jgi:thymidylate synthase
MYYSADTLDDILRQVLQELLRCPFNVATSRGLTSEIVGVYLKLENPLARLSRSERKSSLFSALGELLWYLAQSDKIDFISHYVTAYKKEVEADGVTIHGAYGPRLFNSNNQK